ncbi:MAG TPA: WbuC family cupin fold metalloprotein [Candidatus Caenarcaniphilales bacterium]
MNSSAIKYLDQELLNRIALTAHNNSRLRQNYNFHNPAEKVQRFINVLQPGTYVRPHRHRRDSGVNGFEFFLALQGTLGLLILNDQGQVIQQQRVSADGPVRAVELAEGTYHTLVALAPNTAILELKEGPYEPSTDKEFLETFPQEGTGAAQRLVETWQLHFN